MNPRGSDAAIELRYKRVRDALRQNALTVFQSATKAASPGAIDRG